MSAELTPADITPATEPQRPVGPGARLREAREARGLSLAAAAGQLKLKQGIIAALEADDYQKLPSILFARGYLRSYARLLEIPVDEAVGALGALGLDDEPPAVPRGAILTNRRRGENLLLKWGSLVVLVVLGVLLVAWFHDESASSLLARLSPKQTSTSGTQKAPGLEIPGQSAGMGSTAALAPPPTETQPAPLTPEPEPLVEQPPAEAGDHVVAAAPATDAAAPTAPEPQIPAATTPLTPETHDTATAVQSPAVAVGSDRLVLTISEDSWTEVTDARGERLVYELLKAGTVREVGGQGPFQVFLGNAPGVELRYNGELVTGVHASSRGVARLTLGAATPGGQ